MGLLRKWILPAYAVATAGSLLIGLIAGLINLSPISFFAAASNALFWSYAGIGAFASTLTLGATFVAMAITEARLLQPPDQERYDLALLKRLLVVLFCTGTVSLFAYTLQIRGAITLQEQALLSLNNLGVSVIFLFVAAACTLLWQYWRDLKVV